MKMRNYLYVLLLLCISNTFVFAQSGNDSVTNDIFNTKKFRKGFYTSYEEFLKNSPSIDDTVTLEERPAGDVRINGGGFYTLKKYDQGAFYYEDQQLLRKLIKHTWGYCDGKNIYIFDHLIHKNRYDLSRIILLDKISVVEHFEIETAHNSPTSTSVGAGIMFGLVGVLISQSINQNIYDNVISKNDTSSLSGIFRPTYTYLLDNTDDGKISYFYYKSVMEILYYRDIELYEALMKEPKNERIGLLSYYVMLFNKNHSEKK